MKSNVAIKSAYSQKLAVRQVSHAKQIILAIDTSCDETSVAVTQGRTILSSVVSSQVELHKKWGGVVPDIARRAHTENIEPVYREALKRARISEKDIDYVACTVGPGLAIALEVGVDFAKDTAIKLDVPFIPVNHMEGHLLSGLALNSRGKGAVKDVSKIFPALGLLVSGSHTDIVYVKGIGDYEVIGETLDDAAGEAYDKVARMLKLGYPGGPIMTTLSQKYIRDNAVRRKATDIKEDLLDEFKLPIPMEKSDDLNFSYSGLKTACLYKIKSLESKKGWQIAFMVAFNLTVAKSLSVKLEKAIKMYPEVRTVLLGGGVINNPFVVREIGNLARRNGKKTLLPMMKLRGDNAAMIGVAAGFYVKDAIKAKKMIESVDRLPQMRL